MNDKIQLNNGELVTKEQYNQLRSTIDNITQKLNIKNNGKAKNDKHKVLV